MSQSEEKLDNGILQKAINWFGPQFRQSLVNAIQSEFPNHPLPSDVEEVLSR